MCGDMAGGSIALLRGKAYVFSQKYIDLQCAFRIRVVLLSWDSGGTMWRGTRRVFDSTWGRASPRRARPSRNMSSRPFLRFWMALRMMQGAVLPEGRCDISLERHDKLEKGGPR